MADLVVGVVNDVLRHVTIQHQESGDVIRSETRDEGHINWSETLIGGSPKFRILNPQIGLDLLERAQECQNRDVALCDWCAVVIFCREGHRRTRQDCRPNCCSACGYHPTLQKRPTIPGTTEDTFLFFHY